MKRIEVFAYFTTYLMTVNSIVRIKFRLGVFKKKILIYNFEIKKVPNVDTLFIDLLQVLVFKILN